MVLNEFYRCDVKNKLYVEAFKWYNDGQYIKWFKSKYHIKYLDRIINSEWILYTTHLNLRAFNIEITNPRLQRFCLLLNSLSFFLFLFLIFLKCFIIKVLTNENCCYNNT